jgi:hypothetical protein
LQTVPLLFAQFILQLIDHALKDINEPSALRFV